MKALQSGKKIIVHDEISQFTYFIVWMRFDPFQLLDGCVASLLAIHQDSLGGLFVSVKSAELPSDHHTSKNCKNRD